jgi:hypothetical protein
MVFVVVVIVVASVVNRNVVNGNCVEVDWVRLVLCFVVDRSMSASLSGSPIRKTFPAASDLCLEGRWFNTRAWKFFASWNN